MRLLRFQTQGAFCTGLCLFSEIKYFNWQTRAIKFCLIYLGSSTLKSPRIVKQKFSDSTTRSKKFNLFLLNNLHLALSDELI